MFIKKEVECVIIMKLFEIYFKPPSALRKLEKKCKPTNKR